MTTDQISRDGLQRMRLDTCIDVDDAFSLAIAVPACQDIWNQPALSAWQASKLRVNSVFRLSRQACHICRHLGASQAERKHRHEASIIASYLSQYGDSDTVDDLQLCLANETHERHEVPACGIFRCCPGQDCR